MDGYDKVLLSCHYLLEQRQKVALILLVFKAVLLLVYITVSLIVFNDVPLLVFNVKIKKYIISMMI